MTVYRGQDRAWHNGNHGDIIWFVADPDDDVSFDLAYRYTWGEETGAVYRGRLLDTAIRGTHPDFDNESIGTEDGDGRIAEILCEQGADYMMHAEANTITIGIRTDRIGTVLENTEELLVVDDDVDAWHAIIL